MYDTFQEHCDYEMNAAYDYVSEAYGATARDCDMMADDDQAYEAEMFRLELIAFGPSHYVSPTTGITHICEIVDGQVVSREVRPTGPDYEPYDAFADMPF